jgi:NitT/TauT family transport system substrate-binding protein
MVALVTGCSNGVRDTHMPAPGPRPAPPSQIRLGTLPTEDALPLWTAEQQGTFDKMGVAVKIVAFSSAQKRDAAFRSGTIDGFIGDIFTVATLRDQGFKGRIITVCLGSTPMQGRVGLVSAYGSRLSLASQLENVRVATPSGTMDEYVLDGLMHAHKRSWTVKKRYVQSAQERYDLLVQGNVKAAILPEPYLSLAIRQRAHLIVDDTKGRNLSQTVLVFSDSFLATPGGASAVDRLMGAWDSGSSNVNSRRKIFRPLLAEKARLPVPLKEHYRMSSYPHHQLPTRQEISDVLTWMQGKGLLRSKPTYADMTWTP